MTIPCSAGALTGTYSVRLTDADTFSGEDSIRQDLREKSRRRASKCGNARHAGGRSVTYALDIAAASELNSVVAGGNSSFLTSCLLGR